MNIDELLKIDNPCLLFPNDLDEAKTKYRQYSFDFHPDKNNHPKANDVFAHITNLYNKVIELINRKEWQVLGLIEIADNMGKQYRIRYKKHRIFELGDMYISPTVVVYIIDIKYKSLYDNFKRQISFQYKNNDMKKEFERYMPKLKASFETDTKCVLVIEKTPDVFLLADVIEYFERTTYVAEWDKHVAWIQSRLLNILCFLQYNNKVHNAISDDTVFISPQHHSVLLLGGWFYCVPNKSKMISIPAKLYNLLPPLVKSEKIARKTTDGELVKAICKDISKGVALPKPFENWLNYGANKDPVKDFKVWQEKILKESYGERKFIKWDLLEEQIYGD